MQHEIVIIAVVMQERLQAIGRIDAFCDLYRITTLLLLRIVVVVVGNSSHSMNLVAVRLYAE